MGSRMRIPASVGGALLAAFALALPAAAAEAPAMIRINGAVFTMGHAGGEPDEGPPQTITLKPFAIGVTEVTRGQFAAYVKATGASIGTGCNIYEQGKLVTKPDLSWRNPGFAQTDDHPVVCISPLEARDYAAWLAQSTGRKFRLLTEAEWEYVARIQTEGDDPWPSPDKACQTANLLDRDTARAEAGKIVPAAAAEPAAETGARPRVAPCSDGYVHTAPVGKLTANPLGVHDIIGNVWELVADCHADSLAEVPADGKPVVRDGCTRFVVRGGAWVVGPNVVRFMQRGTLETSARKFSIGFRLAEDIAP